MKKTLYLNILCKDSPRDVNAIKLELTRYMKRERRKTLPVGVDFWDFNCKVGPDSMTAAAVPLYDLAKEVETFALANVGAVNVEILASPGYRVKKNQPSAYHHQ